MILSKNSSKLFILSIAFILFSCFGFNISASSNTEQWSKQYGSTASDTLNSIQQTSDGGYIAAGYTLGSVGGNTSLGGKDGWILKIASNGSEQWSKQYGGISNDALSEIQKISDGSYIAVGNTGGSVGGNTSLGGNDGWILKIASDGSEQWSKQYGGTSNDYLYSIKQTNYDGFIVSGFTSGIVGGNVNLGSADGWIIRLNEQFELSFNFNGASGTIPKNQSIFAGELANKPSDPVKGGYTFKGWNTKIDGSGTTWGFTKTKMPANNVTLYAQWEKNVDPKVEYTLEYDLNGGQGIAPANQTLNEGQKAIKPSNPSKEGYVFKEWNTAKDGSGETWSFDSSIMPAKDVTLYAQWVKKDLPITGDSSNLVFLNILLILSGCTLIIIKKKTFYN